ncbi:MAG: hypothetical protein ACI97N_000135 [Cognaticolwellia sp.]|jgi:hypothetical protein
MKFLKIYFSLLLVFCLSGAYAQVEEVLNSPSGVLVNIHYGGEVPSGILAERFGAGFSIGFSPVYMSKRQWLFGLDAKFIFAGEVKEDVLANLKTRGGEIIGQDKGFAITSLNQRGYFIGGTFGKIIPLKEDRRSGVRVLASAGFLRHKVRIDDGGTLPQLNGAYRLGYDRLTYGFGITEFVGYQYLSRNRLINFYAGMEFTQGFTKNRRTVNYDTGLSETGNRQDLLWGFKIGWILPLYDAKSTEIFY